MQEKLIPLGVALLMVLGIGSFVALSRNTESTEAHSALTASSTPVVSGGITLEQVAQHASRESCWSVINGSVYDLTGWIPNHPGGERAILSMCGTDGSARFNGQHGGSARPTSILAGFKIGELAGAAPAAASAPAPTTEVEDDSGQNRRGRDSDSRDDDY